MKTQHLLFLTFLLFPFFVSAQCTVNAGSDTTFCSPNSNTNTFYLGDRVVIQNGTAPYTYEWSTNYQDPIFGLRTASYYLDDSTVANPEIINFTREYADSANLNALPYYLKVTDAMGQTCRDTIDISATQWLTNTDDCRFDVPLGTAVGLRANIAGGLPPYTFAWSPNAGLNDSTLGNPSATPDSSLTYVVTITDQIGCTFQNSCTIYLTSSGLSLTKKPTPFSISPNPMRTTTLILLENLNFEDTYLEIIDLHGKIVFTQTFTSDKMEFSSENMSAGIYICQIKDRNKVLASKNLFVIGE